MPTDELLQDFVEEAKTHIEKIEAAFLDTEKLRNSDDAINGTFRAIHSIKGAGGFFQLKKIVSLSHAMENLLGTVRSKAIFFSDEVLDALLFCNDTLKQMVFDVEKSELTDISGCLSRLDAAANSPSPLPPSAAVPPPGGGLKDERSHALSLASLSEGGGARSATEGGREAAGGSSKPAETIRVNVHALEKLIDLSGEMVLARNQLLTAFSKGAEYEDMARIMKNVDMLTSKMQQEIMMVRMQPVMNIFGKFKRIILEMSRKMNKEISLEIEGGEIELDKTMIEALVDPITHLVRNCADHGIETSGTIKLGAYHRSGFVAIEVTDDGRGIDPAVVKQKAVEKGLITQKESGAMGDGEALKLIFAPGFSTLSEVSDISGRGVGMDVVRSNVEKLGGSVSISSQVGKGTTMLLLLPRTLAIIRALLVGACGQRFAVPERSIVHVIEGVKVDHIGDAREFRFRGSLLPAVSLAEILGMKVETAPTKIVIVRMYKKQIALLVDEIFDTEEILVKPLPKAIKSCEAYSGVTIMGDGSVLIILDVDGIAKKFDAPVQEKTPQQKNMLEYQNMVFFKCSGTELYALDMNMIARVETVDVSDIDEIGTEKYVKIRGKTLRVIRPETYLPVKSAKYKSKKLTVIVPNLVKHPIGILLGGIVDNVKAHFELDTEQIKHPGVFGTIIYQNRVALILNLYELFEVADPINYPKIEGETKGARRVLVVEDTPFFQRIEERYLTETGCDVTVAENGEAALKILKEKTFDAIVSDLMMPVMGGLEFIQQVRKMPKLRNIPAIALSSMTSDFYVSRALEYGFDAYENKLNKESLLATLEKIIKAKSGGEAR